MNAHASRMVFSLNSFAAAVLALFIALGLGLVNPYWAAMTVYIVSQPQAGSVRSKALYRVIGTAVGAAVAVGAVPLLVDAPELLSLTLAVWVGLCLAISLLDRTPRAYVFMLSGYTAALIGFPSVSAPGTVFTTAVARVEEICLGITCATLIHSVVLPRGIAGTLEARIDGFLHDAQAWVLDALTGVHDPHNRDVHKLAGDITELHILATHLPFDTSHYHDRSREVGKLAERMAMLLPLAQSVGDRLDALRQAGGVLSPASDRLIADVRAWVVAADTASLDLAASLSRRARGLEPVLGEMPSDDELLRASFHARLAEMIEAWRDCAVLARHLRDGGTAPAPLRAVLADERARRLHRDYGMAVWSGLTASLAILLLCGFWIATSWPDGGTAVMMASIFASFFAGMDDPSREINKVAIWWSYATVVTGIYVFGIVPQVHDFSTLMLVLAPTFLVIGYFMAIPRWTMRMVPLAMGINGTLGIQEGFSPSFAGFMNSSLASIAGVLTASLVTRLVRSVGADFSARRIVRLAERDLASQTRTEPPLAVPAWTGLMVDRVGLLGARVAVRGDPHDLVAQTLRTMRVGLNLLTLRRVGPPRADAPAVGRLLDALRRYWRGRDEGDLQVRIAEAIREVAATPPTPARREALLALTGLGRTLVSAVARTEPA